MGDYQVLLCEKTGMLHPIRSKGDAIGNAACCKKILYIISIANAKYVQTPGNATQKYCLTSGIMSIVVIIANHIKK